ncbi:MLO12 protein [Hibiscus syriacus]|uniref:MLO12 protein n=1 Tax=Hibiscus syriacus TaxID=106335 RepID=A0A6A3A913_HIBSY|nr:transmembrane protein 209-like [Hibiscus syriacus]KAE8700237.1 MLO12 protein [Hibiscus syriacus]
MEAAGNQDRASPPSKPSKFSVYQNPTLSAALTATSLQPSKSTILCIFFLSSASALALLYITSRGTGLADKLKIGNFSEEVSYTFAKGIQTVSGVVFIGTIFALFKALSLHRTRSIGCVPVVSPSKAAKDQSQPTKHQLGLLGIKPKVEQVAPDSSKKPPKSKPPLKSSSDVLVPLHPQINGSDRKSLVNSNKSNTSGGNKMNSFASPSRSGGSPLSYHVPASSSALSPLQTSPGQEPVVKTPWSTKRASYTKEITTKEQLERFLAEVDEKITESAGKLATPPSTISGFGIASPNTVASSANTSGTTRSTPLRPVRMSPGSQKFTTPPKKGEGDLPPPMSIEESIEAFEHLGIYPLIELWRDRLRQWFSSVLLNPLLNKIETSHIQVMQAAAKLGISVAVTQVGSDLPTNRSPATSPKPERMKEWQPAFTLEEEGLLHQLSATLVQALEASMSNPLTNQQQAQQNPLIPVMQECINAITEHQRLHALMKGEWMKGLLPQSSVRANYTVQRIRKLAEGTCLKNYEYLGGGEVFDKKNKNWTHELPTDSHLLLYLFCAFMEHPKWMLRVDPTSYAGAQSSKNPLFLGVLPLKDRLPEKYVAVILGVPSILHPGACILAVGKQNPPVFVLYWDKKSQFSLQGRSALWDSILLLCYRIKVEYGGTVRGMHLASSALNILPVLDPQTEA